MKGGGSSGSQTVTNVTKLPAWVEKGGQENLNFANKVAARPYEAFGGDTVAGLTQDQLDAFDAFRAGLGKYSASADQGLSMMSDLPATASGFLNPYIHNVERYALDAVNDAGAIAQNQLSDRAEAAGAFGGSRYGIQAATLAAETAKKAGEISAGIRSEGWDKALASALATSQGLISGAGQGQAVSSAAAGDLLKAGLIQQGQDQQELADVWRRWQEQHDYPLEQLAIRQSALSATPYGSTTTSTQPYNQNTFAQGIGTLGTLGQLGYLGYLIGTSDPAVKTDAEPIGIRPDGIRLWKFRYVGGDRHFVGVMANEVREIRPDAVVRGTDGFDRVDYNALGMRLEPLPVAA